MNEGSDNDDLYKQEACVSPTPAVAGARLEMDAQPVMDLSPDDQEMQNGGGGGGDDDGGGGGGGGVMVTGKTESPTSDNGRGRMSRASSRGEAGAREKIFECSVCLRCFGYKHVLQNHERTHTGEKPFKCKTCEKRFTRDHHLKTHMRLHTGEKPYHCTHCSRDFVQVANLRRHLRVHTGERPYCCEVCTSRFSDSNQLKAHMLIHRGEKPFHCIICQARFRRRHHERHHKCPMLPCNQGRPRRGRRPKTGDDLEQNLQTLQLEPRDQTQLPHDPHDERDSSSHDLPTTTTTMVPSEPQEQVPKRARKPRETRRIMKVQIPTPPMMVQGGLETGHYHHALVASFSGHSSIPLPPPPPEQTEPEDLSMHANHGASGKNGQAHTRSRGHSRQPDSGGWQLQQAPSSTNVYHERLLLAPRMLMPDDDDGDESEAMVEEEEDDDSSGEDVARGLQWHGRHVGRVQHDASRMEPVRLELDETDEDEEYRGLRHDLEATTVKSDGDSDMDMASDQGRPHHHHQILPLHHGHHLVRHATTWARSPEASHASRGNKQRRHGPHQPHHHVLHDPIHLAPHHQVHLAHDYHEPRNPYMYVHGGRRLTGTETRASSTSSEHDDYVLPPRP